jgi:beta-lactamase class A
VIVSVAGLLAFGGVEVANAGRSRHRSAASGAREGHLGGQAGSAKSHGQGSPGRRVDPLKTKTVDRLVSASDGRISAAVENLRTGQEWLLNRGDRDQTASIVKADILETLMYQRGRTAAGLEELERSEGETAEGMIEESDNVVATDLWDEVGESRGIAAYNRLAGLKDTSPNADGYWGETLTTAADQIRLLRQLAMPSKLLTTADRDYELYLMRHVAGYEDWGVNGGVPSSVSVALKNGWVPLGDGDGDDDDMGWEINSIGWVKGDGRDYLIAVLTAHDPSEEYGIDSIERLSGDVYRSLKPDRRAQAL